MKRFLRYLIHTRTLSIKYDDTYSQLIQSVYVDADWAGFHDSRKSISRRMVIMGGTKVYWFLI